MCLILYYILTPLNYIYLTQFNYIPSLTSKRIFNTQSRGAKTIYAVVICCSGFLPPATAYPLTLCNPASALKVISLKSVLSVATSSWGAHFPTFVPFSSLSFLTTLQHVNPFTLPSWTSVLSWLLDPACSVLFLHIASTWYKVSVINAQHELSSGSQNWMEARLHYQESQFSEIFSFLYNVVPFLDPLINLSLSINTPKVPFCSAL